MKILEISSSDLPGRLFNGYELHKSLIFSGYEANQIVLEKFSEDKTVHSVLEDRTAHLQMREWERIHSVSHVIIPYGYKIKQMDVYQKADIVHFHILHNHMISLFDYETLLGNHRSVWTIHDPWIFTGNCIHPLDCEKWKHGCNECERLHEDTFDMDCDNTNFMWRLKREVLRKINPYVIVASNFMKRFLEESPFTRHFNHIRVIPFGIKSEKYRSLDKRDKRKKYNFTDQTTVIGFRADNFHIKGCKYLYQMLDAMEGDISLICVGTGIIPARLKEKFPVVELGWVNKKEAMLDFWGAIDIFVMPSLAEGFGVMAIEAMAAGCAVMCFEGTTVEEITDAPKCGISAKYKSAQDMKNHLEYLLEHKDEIRYRGELGRKIVAEKYDYHHYVAQHIDLYKEIYCNS